MLSIKKAENAQTLESIATLAAEIWQEHFTPILAPGQVAYMLEKFQSAAAITRQTQQEGYTYYQLLQDERPVGYFAVKEEENYLFLSKLYLHKSCRGKGYASLAMEKIRQLCKSSGLDKIRLTVNRHNTATIEVYRHFGFRIYKEYATDIGGGYVMDDYFMELDISNGKAEEKHEEIQS